MFEYNFQAGRSVFQIQLQQEHSIFNFMKANQPLAPKQLRSENGELILSKENEELLNVGDRKKRNHQVFRSYIGQFCSGSAKNLIKSAADLFHEDNLEQDEDY